MALNNQPIELTDMAIKDINKETKSTILSYIIFFFLFEIIKFIYFIELM